MMNKKAQHDIVRKLKILNYAKNIGNVSKTAVISVYVEKHFIHGNALTNLKEK